MDDVALLAPSYEELQALAEELWAWCWRFRAARRRRAGGAALGRRRSSCSDVGFAAFLAASGARRPRSGLAELRDDLARAFASTFGEFFVARASEITALPPRRST
ncbi:hypothetical protein JL720_5239 [Aureococcus anophagefferens]|nr:hypothetical protein JL720_5239 [Aureococcus anophagefferens]